MAKTIVGVIAKHDMQGKVTPLKVIWPDSRQFSVDRIIDVRMAGAMKAGGHGTCYICRIHGKEVNLFFDSLNRQWFIEY